MHEEQDLRNIHERLDRIMGSRPIATEPVERGYTEAYRLIVEFSNGLRAFVKASYRSYNCRLAARRIPYVPERAIRLYASFARVG